MKTTTRRDTRTRGIGWLAGTVGGLLLISLGLELLAHQMFGQTDVATFLLSIYLAFWFSMLGMLGFVVLSIAWLLGTPKGRRSSRVADPGDYECLRPPVMPAVQSRQVAGRR
jgi:hypothetical protein